MSAQHTPGEWSVVERGNCGFGPEGDVIGPSTDCIRGDYTLADARLIAAAPDLLAALEQIALLDESGPDFSVQGEDGIWRVEGRKGGKIEAIARTAIAKAKGSAA